VKSDGKGITETITDCTIEVICAHEKDGDLSWEVIIRLIGTRQPVRRMLDAKTMENTREWNAWASNAGCVWNLNDDSRWALKCHLLHQPGALRVVSTVTVSGVLPEFGVVIAHERCIGADGVVVKADENGMFKLRCSDGVTREFLIPVEEGAHVPRLADVMRVTANQREAIRVYLSHLQAWTNHHGGQLIYGWAFACIVARTELMATRPSFPHGYLVGRHQSGKNVMAESILNALCFGHVPGIDASTNPKGVRNRLSGTSGWPLWVNEMDFRENSLKLMGQIRAAFDGQGAEVAKRDGGNRSFPVRRGLLLTGQHIVGSDAEMSRYLIIRLTRVGRDDTKIGDLHASQDSAAAAFAGVLMNRANLARAIVTYVSEYYRAIKKMTLLTTKDGDVPVKIEDRQAWCWAVALGGLRVAWDGDNPTKHPVDALPQGCFNDAVMRAMQARSVAEEEGAIGQFWAAAESLESSGRLSNFGRSQWAKYVSHKGNTVIALALSNLFEQIKSAGKWRSEGNPKFDSLLTEFAEADGYVTHGERVSMGSDGQFRTRWATLFKEDCRAVPDWLRDLMRDAKEVHAARKPYQKKLIDHEEPAG
jgi:hypothetical protein